jgi:hypothetical protein
MWRPTADKGVEGEMLHPLHIGKVGAIPGAPFIQNDRRMHDWDAYARCHDAQTVDAHLSVLPQFFKGDIVRDVTESSENLIGRSACT